MKKQLWLAGLFLLIFSIVLTGCSSENTNQSASNNKNQSLSGNGGGKKNLSFASNPAGSAYNTVASGVSGVLSKHSSLQVAVKPFSGPGVFLPLLNEGQVQLGFGTNPTIGHAFQGIKEMGFNEPQSKLRLILTGGSIDSVLLTVRKDSGIKSTKDLKGKRVASDYGTQKVLQALTEVQLESVGLSWDDVKQVPVTGTTDAMEALRNNRVDAVIGGSLTNSAAMEADASIGLLALNVADISPDQIDSFPQDILDKFNEKVPGFYVEIGKGGFVKEEVIMAKYPMSFITNEQLEADTIYEILDTLWENYQELHPIFAWLEDWKPETFFDETPDIPYHEGAIQFYKDKGVWTEEAEKNNQKLLDGIK